MNENGNVWCLHVSSGVQLKRIIVKWHIEFILRAVFVYVDWDKQFADTPYKLDISPDGDWNLLSETTPARVTHL